MSRSSNSAVSPATGVRVKNAPATQGHFNVVYYNIARSMIGRTVDLLVDATTITQGVVIGVFTEAGRPKLVVGGTKYDPSQVLAVTPTSLN